MNRLMCKEIGQCFGCSELKTHDGFSSHRYECPHLSIWSSEVSDPESRKQVIKEIDEWFKICPKWNTIKGK